MVAVDATVWPNAAETIRALHLAGIGSVLMVRGDHLHTADCCYKTVEEVKALCGSLAQSAPHATG